MSVVIIAEAGVNHNGDINLAKKLVDAASYAGVDYVKFQTFKAEKLVNKNAQKADYQKNNTGESESQLEMLRKLELSEKDHEILIDYCSKKNAKFLSTGFDIESINYLTKGLIDFIKIPSGEITNYPYLRSIAQKRLPIVMSTGMCSLVEVNNSLQVLLDFGAQKEDITILHCNTEYPTPYEDVNLKAMNTIKDELGVKIGYSDHTLGIEVPIAAVALGATIIEKHFTLDRNMEGPDHNASLEPNELRAMVVGIRNIEKALGNGVKEPTKSEIRNKDIARKSIHLVIDLEKGDVISEENLAMKRPGIGISPMDLNKVIGKTIKNNISKGAMLKWEDIE